MHVKTAIQTRRSIRRYQNRQVSPAFLEELLELMRYYPSAANIQPLKFLPVTEPEDLVFMKKALNWAGYLPDYTIAEEEYPPAYILVLGDLSVSRQFEFAAGSAVTELLLAVHEKGLGGCCLGIPEQMKFLTHFQLTPEQFQPLYAVAVGYPKHTGRIVDLYKDCKYTLDAEGNFIVPKRTIGELTVKKEK